MLRTWSYVDGAAVTPSRQLPEGKTAKNRVHLDVDPGPDKAGHVAKLVAAGATVIAEVDEPTGKCTVLQDPEGNEFCVH